MLEILITIFERDSIMVCYLSIIVAKKPNCKRKEEHCGNAWQGVCYNFVCFFVCYNLHVFVATPCKRSNFNPLSLSTRQSARVFVILLFVCLGAVHK